MIKYVTPITLALILGSGVANAKVVKTSNQAVTACKTHLKANVPGFKRAKLGKVRNSRDHHTMTFSVTSEQGRERTKSVVSKEDGATALKN